MLWTTRDRPTITDDLARTTSRTTTSPCPLDRYTTFLASEPQGSAESAQRTPGLAGHPYTLEQSPKPVYPVTNIPSVSSSDTRNTGHELTVFSRMGSNVSSYRHERNESLINFKPGIQKDDSTSTTSPRVVHTTTRSHLAGGCSSSIWWISKGVRDDTSRKHLVVVFMAPVGVGALSWDRMWSSGHVLRPEEILRADRPG